MNKKNLRAGVAARLSVALFAGTCAVQSVQAEPPADAAARFAEAHSLLRRARAAEAYGRFAELADRGHAPSAAMALHLYQNGPGLFGSDWDASQEQLSAWSRVAGRPPALLQGRSYPAPAPTRVAAARPAYPKHVVPARAAP